jgi:hypothetical protein
MAYMDAYPKKRHMGMQVVLPISAALFCVAKQSTTAQICVPPMLAVLKALYVGQKTFASNFGLCLRFLQ